MEPIRHLYGRRGPSRLVSLIAAFMADYSPLTQTVPLLPGKVPLPPRGADCGPQGRGGRRSVELVNGHLLSACCVGALGTTAYRDRPASKQGRGRGLVSTQERPGSAMARGPPLQHGSEGAP